jgi:CheY-like chemotaxis protein
VRILIADDNRDAMLTLGILLRSEGQEVRMAADGLDAIRETADFHPDVALLDLGMPKASGHAVAQDLRRKFAAGCPILIAISGRTSPDDRKGAETSGFHHFVAKPYDPAVLLKLVATLKESAPD